MIKTIILTILAVVVVLISVVLIRTFTYPFSKVEIASQTKTSDPVSEKSIRRLSAGLAIPTVGTTEYDQYNFEPFKHFQQYILDSFPILMTHLEYYTVNEYGMVFKWKGTDTSLQPILLLAHYDVVPANMDQDSTAFEKYAFPGLKLDEQELPPMDSIAQNWQYPPFSGTVAGGRIYGRGALDMKDVLFGILEASEQLAESGFQPKRSVYFAFGQDEEVGGEEGAEQIAGSFATQGLHFEAVYDEGGLVASKGSLGGIDADIALVGIAEKGFLSAQITVHGLGGHSSMPPLQSSVGQAAIIMNRLESDQFKPVLIKPIADFFDNVGGSMSFGSKLAISNRWLLQSLLLKQLVKQPATNALVRTTTALTMMKGSEASNVLSANSTMVVNFRLLPGTTVDMVRAHVKKACEGFNVSIEEVGNTRNASAVSPVDTKGFEKLKAAINTVYPEAIVAPYLTIGGTDAFKYEPVSSNIYRFNPVRLNLPEQRSIHNFNEYVSISNYANVIQFYKTLIGNFDK